MKNESGVGVLDPDAESSSNECAVSSDPFWVKIQAPLVTNSDVDLYLVYNEDRSVELTIPAGVFAELDEAMSMSPVYKIFCEACVVDRQLVLSPWAQPETDPEW